MERAVGRRALGLIAAACVAMVVVSAAASATLRIRDTSSLGGSRASIESSPGAAAFDAAALQARPAVFGHRPDGSLAKGRHLLFAAVLLTGLLLARTGVWAVPVAPSVGGALSRRRHTVSLRAPPLAQLV